MFDEQSMETDPTSARKLVWEIDKKLQEDVARPIIFHARAGDLLAALRQGHHRHGQQLLQRLSLRGRVAGQVAARFAAKGAPEVAAYIVRRFALMLVTLFGISVIIFVLLRIVPGNIVDILFDAAGMIDPADKAQLEHDLGLDRPILVQYCTGSAALRAAISAIPMSPRGRRSTRSLPRIPDHGAAGRAGAAVLPCCSAFPWASSARCARTRPSIMCCASSA